MSYKLHPFTMNRSYKEQVGLSIPRSLSYINNLYQNVQLAEGFGRQGSQIKLDKGQSAPKCPPRAQRAISTSCDPELRPIITRRRAKSLPSSPEKITVTKCQPRCHKVRFADSLGLELAEVKVFNAADYPSIPLHVLSRLSINSDLCCSQDLEFSIQYLEPDFQLPPADSGEFLNRLQEHGVCLEKVSSSEEQGISGTIRVLNIAFEKKVLVRYSFTDWKTHCEVGAAWQSSDIGTNSDRFAFVLPLPPFLQQICPVIQFAVSYQVAGREYWDNNLGKNYTFTYRSHSLKMPKDSEQSWIHFI
ncbi:protein phosphatase 1 regulatory subunit 3D [Rhinophrynus dorsalis]